MLVRVGVAGHVQICNKLTRNASPIPIILVNLGGWIYYCTALLFRITLITTFLHAYI